MSTWKELLSQEMLAEETSVFLGAEQEQLGLDQVVPTRTRKKVRSFPRQLFPDHSRKFLSAIEDARETRSHRTQRRDFAKIVSNVIPPRVRILCAT